LRPHGNPFKKTDNIRFKPSTAYYLFFARNELIGSSQMQIFHLACGPELR
jgi:hypothetical protein